MLHPGFFPAGHPVLSIPHIAVAAHASPAWAAMIFFQGYYGYTLLNLMEPLNFSYKQRRLCSAEMALLHICNTDRFVNLRA
jgi:hypothetical protein